MKCKDCNNYACPERSNGETVCIFQQWTAKEPFDWQSFRAEASKDILCAIFVDQRISENTPYKGLVKMSLECTNELIKQLKEKEEK